MGVLGSKWIRDKEARKICKLHKQGMSFNAIAKKLGRSRYGISRAWYKSVEWFEDNDLKEESAPPKPHISTMKDLTAMAAEQKKAKVSYGNLTAIGFSPALFLPKEDLNNPDTKGCQGCAYWRDVSSGGGTGNACHYCVDNCKSRGCPSGSKCTKKKVKIERRKV